MTYDHFNAANRRARAEYQRSPISTRYCADETCYQPANGSSDFCLGHGRVLELGLAEYIEEEVS